MISAAAGGPAAGQPGLHRPGPHSGLGGDLIDRQVAEVVQNQRTALFGGHLAQGVAERDPVRGGSGGGLWPGNQRPEAGTVTGTPPPRGRDAPRRDADPGLGRRVPVDLAAARPGPHERLLHGVLSLALVSDHRVELPHQPLEAGGVEVGEFLTLHCISPFPGKRAARSSACHHEYLREQWLVARRRLGCPGGHGPPRSRWPNPVASSSPWDHHRMAVTQARVALVTGSSRGLGAVIARRLARDGFAVAVNSRPGDEQVAAVGAAIRDDGGTAEGFYADVTDEDQVAGLVTAIADCLGPVEVLVLNATGPQPEAAVTDVAWAGHLAQ